MSNLSVAGGAVARRSLIFWSAAVVAGVAYALVVGVISAILPTPLFSRAISPTAWNLLFWVASSVLFGPLAASYLVPPSIACATRPGESSLTFGGVLSFLAVGCPVCNKLVVLALGASGAVTYFEPAQPWLGALSLALLGFGIWTRFDLPGALRPAWRSASFRRRRSTSSR